MQLFDSNLNEKEEVCLFEFLRMSVNVNGGQKLPRCLSDSERMWPLSSAKSWSSWKEHVFILLRCTIPDLKSFRGRTIKCLEDRVIESHLCNFRMPLAKLSKTCLKEHPILSVSLFFWRLILPLKILRHMIICYTKWKRVSAVFQPF